MANRDLDTEVARWVYGWAKTKVCVGIAVDPSGVAADIPRYSLERDLAVRVAEKMVERGFDVLITRRGEEWEACFWRHGGGRVACDPEFQVAVCRAAVSAAMKDE